MENKIRKATELCTQNYIYKFNNTEGKTINIARNPNRLRLINTVLPWRKVQKKMKSFQEEKFIRKKLKNVHGEILLHECDEMK